MGKQIYGLYLLSCGGCHTMTITISFCKNVKSLIRGYIVKFFMVLD